jgi:hypothetical protein
MANPLLEKLLDPIIEGENYFESWKISHVEFPNLDQPRIVLRLENESGNAIKLVMSPGDAAAPCYERTPSFNLAFATEKEGPLEKNEEEAIIYVIEAVRLNDHGRFSIEYDDNHVPVLKEAPPKPTIMSKLLDVLFPPRKKTDTPQPDQSGTGVPPEPGAQA